MHDRNKYIINIKNEQFNWRAFAIRDPTLASKFNRLQLFLCETPAVPVLPKLGFEKGILRPSRPSTYSPFNHGTNQCRARTGQMANFGRRDNPVWFIRPAIAVLILNLIDCTRCIFLKRHFQNLWSKNLCSAYHNIILKLIKYSDYEN